MLRQGLDAAFSLGNEFEQLQTMLVRHGFRYEGKLRIEGALGVGA